jgi:hypothetical protein
MSEGQDLVVPPNEARVEAGGRRLVDSVLRKSYI